MFKHIHRDVSLQKKYMYILDVCRRYPKFEFYR
jgi:hypothetical protein